MSITAVWRSTGCTASARGARTIYLLAAMACFLPLGIAHAEDACQAAWSSSTVYTSGNLASEGGINYKANWWTQGDDPATHNGGAGSGQPWTSQGACSSDSGGGDTGGGDTGGGDTGGGDTGGGDTGGGTTTPTYQNFVLSPYKDITINLNWNTYAMSTKVTGSLIPVVGTTSSLLSTELTNLDAITLAFATGTCGSESWGGVTATDFANANIQALANNGTGYIISTGGASGTFNCASAAGMNSFISRYYTSKMIGVDFDIEGSQTASQIADLVAAAAAAEQTYPNLRFSFTLATLAASDGSYGGLNASGAQVVQAVLASGMSHYTINLMVMDFGSATAANCVLGSSGLCQMGQSAIQAVQNLQHTYGISASHIEVTPMIGRNDAADEIFTLADVDTVSVYAAQNGLAGVHFWSLDRDTPCSTSTTYASPICNSYDGPGVLSYTKRFLSDLGY